MMSDEISVHAAGRGNPWINLSDGREVITPYSGPGELTQILERNEARPLSLCSADFDESVQSSSFSLLFRPSELRSKLKLRTTLQYNIKYDVSTSFMV